MSAEPPEVPSSGTSLIRRIPSALKQHVVDRAVNAVNHLVGAYAPRILADSQSARDERNARSTIIAEVAKEAAKQAAADPEVAARMLNRLFGEEIKAQVNREAVAAKAIEHLKGETIEKDDDDTSKPIDDDWLNLFSKFAERATSESLQDIWARILAGEIRKPGAFSPVTLQFISIVDAPTAAIINKVLPWAVDQDWIPNFAIGKGLEFSDLIFLEEIGFGSGSPGTLSMTMNCQPNGTVMMRAGNAGIVVENNKQPVTLPAFNLSLAGKQLCRIVNIESKAVEIIDGLKRTIPRATISLGTVEPAGGGQYHFQNMKEIYRPAPSS